MNKLLLLIICLLPGVTSASVFDDAYNMPAQGFLREASRVAIYAKENVGLDIKQQLTELQYLSGKLQAFETQQIKNPVYWFVRGLHARNLASYYQQIADKNRVEEYIQDKNSYYQRAMDLDKASSIKLSAAAYAVMKPGLPDVLKQRAIETELNLGGSGEDDSYYWYLHWSNINALSQQNRFAEAQLALDKMQKELQEKGMSDSVYVSLLNKAEAEVTEQKRQLESEKKSTQNQPAVTKDNPLSEFVEEYLYFLIWFASILLVLLLALLFYLYEKKRKSR
ncbi:MAG: hypothetical protein OEY36_01375 [Gammaproteobacteria bacterium]|nr:hypothetical protein [Gammaproteobacteria bacterium]